jgi:hypothetical protein
VPAQFEMQHRNEERRRSSATNHALVIGAIISLNVVLLAE